MIVCKVIFDNIKLNVIKIIEYYVKNKVKNDIKNEGFNELFNKVK